jgi:hypothetical protein
VLAAAGLEKGKKNFRSLSPPSSAPHRIGAVADVKARAGKGHEFGLRLSANEKKALIAFLKTL